MARDPPAGKGKRPRPGKWVVSWRLRPSRQICGCLQLRRPRGYLHEAIGAYQGPLGARMQCEMRRRPCLARAAPRSEPLIAAADFICRCRSARVPRTLRPGCCPRGHCGADDHSQEPPGAEVKVGCSEGLVSLKAIDSRGVIVYDWMCV